MALTVLLKDRQESEGNSIYYLLLLYIILSYIVFFICIDYRYCSWLFTLVVLSLSATLPTKDLSVAFSPKQMATVSGDGGSTPSHKDMDGLVQEKHPVLCLWLQAGTHPPLHLKMGIRASCACHVSWFISWVPLLEVGWRIMGCISWNWTLQCCSIHTPKNLVKQKLSSEPLQEGDVALQGLSSSLVFSHFKRVRLSDRSFRISSSSLSLYFPCCYVSLRKLESIILVRLSASCAPECTQRICTPSAKRSLIRRAFNWCVRNSLHAGTAVLVTVTVSSNGSFRNLLSIICCRRKGFWQCLQCFFGPLPANAIV